MDHAEILPEFPEEWQDWTDTELRAYREILQRHSGEPPEFFFNAYGVSPYITQKVRGTLRAEVTRAHKEVMKRQIEAAAPAYVPSAVAALAVGMSAANWVAHRARQRALEATDNEEIRAEERHLLGATDRMGRFAEIILTRFGSVDDFARSCEELTNAQLVEKIRTHFKELGVDDTMADQMVASIGDPDKTQDDVKRLYRDMHAQAETGWRKPNFSEIGDNISVEDFQ